MSAIKTRDVSKTDSGTTAVAGIDLTIPVTRTHALVERSG